MTTKTLKVGLMITATGKYERFLQPLITSADKFFLPNHNVEYCLFTSAAEEFVDKLVTYRPMVHWETTHEPWPAITLFRFKRFVEASDLLDKYDYLFYCDADMRFVDKVGDEIISERTAVLHPGFIGKPGSVERNPLSLACIPTDAKNSYYAGAFYGGTSAEILKMSRILSDNIDKDLEKDIVAVWHDESHSNNYFWKNPPTRVLPLTYCYPEKSGMAGKPKLVGLSKSTEFDKTEHKVTPV